MDKPLRNILEEYKQLRETLLRIHANVDDYRETIDGIREQLYERLLEIRQEQYEAHGEPFGSSVRAVEIWAQCRQYTTRN